MTLGTSPRPLGAASMAWTAAEHGLRAGSARLGKAWAALIARRSRLARGAAALYLAALGILLMSAWGVPVPDTVGHLSGMTSAHLAFLMATGAGMAFFTLAQNGSREADANEPQVPPRSNGLSDLLAQMSHELRTPLNAVIGFSEVMLRELHGPLGNARYQEYAHHISESGGRMLKSSEDALAVAEAMTVLLANRMHARRERMVASSLVREAWRAAAEGDAAAAVRLAVTTCTTCEITCDRRATLQAIENLLREALARTLPGGSVSIAGKRRAGLRTLTIRSGGAQAASPNDPGDAGTACVPARPETGGLRVILARLLLETQGAELTCEQAPDGTWTAVITFGKA
jgi:signal transduction histidine kinase